MPKKLRKRKFESDDEDEVKWELTNILSEQLQDEMGSMWEIPQIFHFLRMFKDVLNISHLSMYETERMLAMPRASKQLANIMTCLLSAPLPKAKIRKTPPMPYEFWVNLVIHKVKGWFKVYRNKRQDITKVFEAIGVEPGFWRIFPDLSIIDKKDFDELTFKERIWILKSICDTLFHTRKTIQDMVSKQTTQDHFETILGVDRYGAKYFYFPLFLDRDLRVYRHCIDNTILSTVKAPRLPKSVPKPEKFGRNKRKRSRWKNGSLPVREKRRSKRMLEDEIKLSGDSAIGSLISEDTNMSGISGCSNNNSIAIETRKCLRSSSTTPEENLTPSETQCSNPKSSGYDTNTSSDAKSVNNGESDEVFRRLGCEADNENSMDRICTIQDILDELTSKVSESLKADDPPNVQDELDSCSNLYTTEETKEEEEAEKSEEDDSSKIIDENMSESDREESRIDSDSDHYNWTDYKPKTLSTEILQKKNIIFYGMLDDLSVSNFELVADSVETLRDLAASLLTNQVTKSRSKTAPICEMALATRIEELIDSLKDVEPVLKESAVKARRKLQKEWIMFKDGVVENRDTSGDVDDGSNRWILGSQGCPLFASSDATLQALSEIDLPSPSPEIPVRRSSSGESNDESTGDQTPVEKRKSERRVKIAIEKEEDDDDDDENDDTQDSKTEPEPRRVLRRRGISSYTEQLSSSEEEAYELEEWSQFKTVDETPATPDSASAVHVGQKNGELDGETAEKESDQDWLLPGARKRKSKRSPTSRKLKASPQKPQPNNIDSKESLLSILLPPPDEAPKASLENPSGLSKDLNSTEAPIICKVESIHSVLDIKDEGPIFEYNRNVTNSLNEDPLQSPIQQQYYAPPPIQQQQQHHQQHHPHPHHHQQQQQSLRPRGPSVAPPRPQMSTNYFVRGPEQYFNPGPPPPYVRYTFPQAPRGTVRYPYPPAPLGYQCPPDQQNYWQYQNYGQMPPRPYPPNMVRPGYSIPRNHSLPQRHQVSSTTLYSARSPSKPSVPRMPAPRMISVQNPNVRAVVRPRLPAPQQQQPVRRYGPRNPTSLPPPGMRVVRPARPRIVQQTKPPATKTTSLILLSDSDDEIEMIVSEKQKNIQSSPKSNRQPTPSNRGKTLTPADRTKTKPVITSEITVPKTREMLSPQMLQRMSQGGISITPVKPPASKQLPVDASPGTKLVVVVNETGSHYALALPNGSKLILTPEQVAQIRASNGGKLVL